MVRGSVRQEGTVVRVRGFFPDGAKIRSFTGAKGTSKVFDSWWRCRARISSK